MLMMRRRRGESILIGDDIEIHIAHIGRTRVKVAIDAPRHVRVVAKEVEEVVLENRSAAAAQPARLLAGRVAHVLARKNAQGRPASPDKGSEG